MTAKKETTEKKCCFYASEFHLEMTIVPYINKKIEENKNIIIITEDNLEETINILISRMNIKNKDYILNLDWSNNNLEKANTKENLIIIINGTKEFIQRQNKNINENIEISPIEVIDCYKFDEIKEEIVEIKEDYTMVINNLQK